jgi:hypothetical protein
MKKVLLGLLGLVVVGIGAVVFFSLKTGSELQPVADALLRDLDAGKVEEVHARAAPAFRDATSLESFRAYVRLRRETLGAYRGVARRTGAGISTSTSEGTRGNVKLELDYEKGRTEAELHFEKVDGTWKLLNLEIVVPEALAPKADPARLEALGGELLDLFARGQLVALYDRFAPELKDAWPAERFQAEMLAFRERMGQAGTPSFRGTEAIEGGYVVARFELPFENGRGEARLKFFWRDLGWSLLGFAVQEA